MGEGEILPEFMEDLKKRETFREFTWNFLGLQATAESRQKTRGTKERNNDNILETSNVGKVVCHSTDCWNTCSGGCCW